jgi:dihydrodipicolinate synthase/N-acetylneuraminate lyase
VFPVPPLARSHDKRRLLDSVGNQRVVSHIRSGGIRNLLYGGNAFLYHVTLSEYEQLLDWLTTLDDELWAIPSAGPSYGRLMDQAALLRRYRFPCVMHLPCGDPRDAAGLERGLREFAEACGIPLLVYLKDETNFGADREAGLDAVARLVDSGVCVGIKYAVIRADPSQDVYLTSLLQRVDRKLVLSGIGERPAVAHMRDFGLPGFTTGSGCLAPELSLAIFEACTRRDFSGALATRDRFLALEDLRDSWGPARVLHAAVTAAGIADCGPIPPFVSGVSAEQINKLAAVALALANGRAVSA